MAKRLKVPNTNSLAEFSAKQTPVARPNKKRRRAISVAESPETTPKPARQRKRGGADKVVVEVGEEGEGEAEGDPITPRPTKTKETEISPIAPSSSVALRPKTKKYAQDPTTTLDKSAQPITLAITPYVDREPKTDIGHPKLSVVVIIHDINKYSRPKWEELCAIVYAKKLDPLDQIRNHTAMEKPRLQKWKYTIGPAKTGQTFEAKNNEDWEESEVYLRTLALGSSKAPNQVNIIADYSTGGERQHTPPSTVSAKGKGKARPHTVRPTRLQSPSGEHEPSSDTLAESEEVEEEDMEEEQPARESATTKQLRAKKASTAAKPKVEQYEQEIYHMNPCKRLQCDNHLKTAMCLEVKDENGVSAHHAITKPMQKEWGLQLFQEVEEVTRSRGPAYWYPKFSQNWQKMGVKRSGNKKDPPPQPALSAAPTPKQEIHNHFTLPSALPATLTAPPTAPAQSYYEAPYEDPPRRRFLSEHDRREYQDWAYGEIWRPGPRLNGYMRQNRAVAPVASRNRLPLAPIAPSSPGHPVEGEDQLAAYLAFLIEKDHLKRETLLTASMAILKENAYMEVEELKKPLILIAAGVKAAIATFISNEDLITEFKNARRIKQGIARGLLQLRDRPAQPSFEPKDQQGLEPRDDEDEEAAREEGYPPGYQPLLPGHLPPDDGYYFQDR